MRTWIRLLVVPPLTLFAIETLWAGGDVPTRFSNQGGIVNTRHNLTQGVGGINASLMDPQRNNYGEVCVYCHTPHGGSGTIAAPLWNRTATTASFTTYDALGTSTLTSSITTPGINSLTCLSCHDGTLGIDSIINMPGSGRYNASQQTSQNNAFLDSWPNPGGTASHVVLGDPAGPAGGPSNIGCMVCHSPTGSGASFSAATDFTAMVIGTDLRDDHPVGINLPTTRIGVDFFNPTGTSTGMRFYDGNGNGRADTSEVRFYDTGQGPEVECASCHDPHGVSPTGPSGTINPTFLRVSNNGSTLCLTCHDF